MHIVLNENIFIFFNVISYIFNIVKITKKINRDSKQNRS